MSPPLHHSVPSPFPQQDITAHNDRFPMDDVPAFAPAPAPSVPPPAVAPAPPTSALTPSSPRRCEGCASPHPGTYGSGRFCSATCAKKVGARHKWAARAATLPRAARRPAPGHLTAPDTPCESCRKPHDKSYGSGRFCSVHCARRVAATRKWEKSRVERVKRLDAIRPATLPPPPDSSHLPHLTGKRRRLVARQLEHLHIASPPPTTPSASATNPTAPALPPQQPPLPIHPLHHHPMHHIPHHHNHPSHHTHVPHAHQRLCVPISLNPPSANQPSTSVVTPTLPPPPQLHQLPSVQPRISQISHSAPTPYPMPLLPPPAAFTHAMQHHTVVPYPTTLSYGTLPVVPPSSHTSHVGTHAVPVPFAYAVPLSSSSLTSCAPPSPSVSLAPTHNLAFKDATMRSESQGVEEDLSGDVKATSTTTDLEKITKQMPESPPGSVETQATESTRAVETPSAIVSKHSHTETKKAEQNEPEAPKRVNESRPVIENSESAARALLRLRSDREPEESTK